MDKQELQRLIEKYNAGIASEEERRKVELWYEGLDSQGARSLDPESRERIKRDIYRAVADYVAAVPAHTPKRFVALRVWLGRAAAIASLAALIGLAFYFPYRDKQQKTQLLAQSQEIRFGNEIPPGQSKAILTLSDGSQIQLSENETGLLTRQGNSRLNSSAEGELVYLPEADAVPESEVFNTLTVPAGGKYRVVLPDGSRVWLNAASSLTYPVAFTGQTRSVKLTGEGYFEVEANKDRPFIVNTSKMQVEATGTHFNVSEYAEDPLASATLIEGAVQVALSNGGSTHQLRPGQQAVYQPGKRDLQVRKADTEAVTGWKNNLFIFDDTGIETVMRQISRWYDVRVIYESAKPDIRFTGLMPRNDSVSSVLKILELTGGVRFIIDGETIYVHSMNN